MPHLRSQLSPPESACCYLFSHPSQHRLRQRLAYISAYSPGQTRPAGRVQTDDILSQTDIILPSQYFGALGSVGLTGEERLMLAVLVDAINVLHSWQGGGNACKRRNFAEAAQWVNTHGTSYPFSFDSVCDALEIDSGLLRSRLRVLTVRSANSARRPALARLRLKELCRSQHMTANRLRRREHVLAS